MSYSYSLLVLDEEGNAVVDQNLNGDKAIKLLATRINQATPAVAEPQKKAKADRPQRSAKSKKEKSIGRFAKKPCCGSTGSRHFKWCTQVGGSGEKEGHST